MKKIENKVAINLNDIRPFLKWAGGKRNLLPYITESLPDDFNNYIEPFLGGGSVLFYIQPHEAIVNDLNSDLINTYNVIKDKPDELIKLLNDYKSKHSKDTYYETREMDRNTKYKNLSKTKKAARIIYLNHTCYNGLYRVNNNGFYNTPMGVYKNPSIYDENNIRAVSHYLKSNNIKILNGDYLDCLKLAKKGDFVYLDPPYDPISSSSAFTKYTKEGFTVDNQIALKEECDKLNKKSIKFLQSNSDTDFIRELYKEYNIKVIKANRNINSKGDKRNKVNELLISNY